MLKMKKCKVIWKGNKPDATIQLDKINCLSGDVVIIKASTANAAANQKWVEILGDAEGIARNESTPQVKPKKKE